MYTLKQRGGFSIHGGQWDILVELEAGRLDENGRADGADATSLWYWLAHQLGHELSPTPVEYAGGHMLVVVHAPDEQPEEQLLRELMERRDWWTAERLAHWLLVRFRAISRAVTAVTVTSGVHTAEQRTCTIRFPTLGGGGLGSIPFPYLPPLEGSR